MYRRDLPFEFVLPDGTFMRMGVTAPSDVVEALAENIDLLIH
jgi:hypothetical protein